MFVTIFKATHERFFYNCLTKSFQLLALATYFVPWAHTLGADQIVKVEIAVT